MATVMIQFDQYFNERIHSPSLIWWNILFFKVSVPKNVDPCLQYWYLNENTIKINK